MVQTCSRHSGYSVPSSLSLLQTLTILAIAIHGSNSNSNPIQIRIRIRIQTQSRTRTGSSGVPCNHSTRMLLCIDIARGLRVQHQNVRAGLRMTDKCNCFKTSNAIMQSNAHGGQAARQPRSPGSLVTHPYSIVHSPYSGSSHIIALRSRRPNARQHSAGIHHRISTSIGYTSST